MDFTTAVKTAFNKYATFSGRALRSEYWWFALFCIIGGVVLDVIDNLLFPGNVVGVFNPIFSLATLIPSLAVGARRLHDIDKSGWWQLLGLIPIVGWIILIIWFAKEGPKADNRFGTAP